MIKKQASKQEINIQNNTGTINIYNTPESEENKEQKKISMAAVDKYSSPLTASITLTPWGDKYHRVSFLLRNDLIGQVLQRNYIVFNEKTAAKEFYDKLVGDMESFKKQAEVDRKHNVLIVADIWDLMTKYEKKYSVIEPPESGDLTIRTDVPEVHHYFQGAKPYGLVFHDIEKHFPSHEGIVKSASKPADWSYNIEKLSEYKPDILSEIKNINSIFAETGKAMNRVADRIVSEPTPENLRELASACISNCLDTKMGKDTKTKILLALKPLLRLRDNDSINKWSESNTSTLLKISESLKRMAVDYSSTGYKKITQDDYDVFIFDADQTLWEGDPAYKFESPISVDGDIARDTEGHELRLKDGVRDMLAGLVMKEKRVGLVSHSEKEGVDFQDQPVILLLKKFNILKYFNEMVVVAQDFPKSIFIPSEDRVLFIDDEIDNLIDVVDHTNADGALPQNTIYSPATVEESIKLTGTVLVKNELKYGQDFIPLIVRAEPEEFILKRRDQAYWEEKEREILDQFWYPSDKIKEEEFQNFLDNMVNNGIRSNTMLEIADDVDSIPMFASNLNILIKLTDTGRQKLSPNSYTEAGRPRIKSKEIPDKPKGNGKYQLDHKKPRWKGGTDTKDNLQWIDEKKHKEKTKDEGSYEYGGKDRHKKLKNKGKEEYSKYQSDTGKAKVEKERKELGEKAFSEKQRERAKKRWKKSDAQQWYKISDLNKEEQHEELIKISNILKNTDQEGALNFVSLFNVLSEVYGAERGAEIFHELARQERERKCRFY